MRERKLCLLKNCFDYEYNILIAIKRIVLIVFFFCLFFRLFQSSSGIFSMLLKDTLVNASKIFIGVSRTSHTSEQKLCVKRHNLFVRDINFNRFD